MRNLLKKIIITMLVIVSLLLIFISISFINHKIQLSKEDSIFIPIGKMINVNGHAIHTYIEGEGKDTLVFMAGGGTSSPTLDFKTLYSLLSNKYEIAIIEKSGYGFSEDSDISRDIDTILEESREALSKSGLHPPYILFPHSMSGIEAIYWAQEYPSEVKSIIGLDIAVPESYEEFSINKFMLNLSAFGSKIGITRFFPSIANDSFAIKDGTLTEEEEHLYRAIFYRRTLTKSMQNEIKEIKISAKKVMENGIPKVPMLLFISNGEGTGWKQDQWIENQVSYIENVNRGKIIKLNRGHYIHNIESEKIAEESRKFIEEINE